MPLRAHEKPVLRLVPIAEPAPSARAEIARPKPALDDAEILNGVRRGDRLAATALHDRVRPQVDRTIARLLGRRDPEHDELAQHAMVEVVMTIDRFRGDCSLDTWTARVTAHAVFNELRSRTSRRKVFSLDSEDTDQIEAQGIDPERDVANRELIRRVRRHLDALDPDKAWTLLLHDVCGHDLREIAQITDASISASQTRLVRGRRELRERLLADVELAGLLEREGRNR